MVLGCYLANRRVLNSKISSNIFRIFVSIKMNIHEVSVREKFEERIIDLPTENFDGVVLRLVVVSTLRTSIVVSKMFCESEYIFSCNDY